MSIVIGQGKDSWATDLIEHGSSLSQQTSQASITSSNLSREQGISQVACCRHVSTSVPETRDAASERWNKPGINIMRTLATFWSFTLMGANDAAYGALIPYLETWYDLTYTSVSLVFLSPLVGCVTAAFLNDWIHLRLGQRGLALIASGCHLIAYVVDAFHPPYPALVFSFMVAGFGNGLADSAWNAWIGNMRNANQMLGFLHGFYGAGATVSPLIATTLVTKAKTPWYYYYYIMIGSAAIEMITSVASFWKSDGHAYCTANARFPGSQSGSIKEALFVKKNGRVTWICALFILGYDGIEVALGGWIVTFMIRVRHAEAFASGVVATGFWLGSTIGSVVLGFVTPLIGEKWAVAIYLPIIMALELIFWLVPQFYVSAVAVSLQGFFLGPLYPAVVVAATRLLPRHLHVSSIGFASAFGGCGAAAVPFAVGAIAEAKGVEVLQPFILAILAAILVIWICLPRISKRENP